MKKKQSFTIAAISIILPLLVAPFYIPSCRAITWGSDTQLTSNAAMDAISAAMKGKDGRLWVMWQSDRGSYWPPRWSIYYKIYNGATWTSDTKLVMNLTWYGATKWHDMNPALLQAKNGTIWVFWASNRTSNYDLFYRTSHNNGSSWTFEKQITTSTYDDNAVGAHQAANGTIFIVWQRHLPNNYEIYYRTTNDGFSWSDEKRLTNTADSDRAPSVTETNNGKIMIVWERYQIALDNFDIFLVTSSDFGVTWSAETRLTTATDLETDPFVFKSIGGKLWLFYSSQAPSPTATSDVWYMYSTSNGVSWTAPIQFTTDNNDDEYSTVTQAKTREMWAFWSSDRVGQPDGNMEVFYRVSTVFQGDVNEDGIVDIIDLATLARSYGTKEGDNLYNPAADVNCDGRINVWDFNIVARAYGSTG